MASSASAVRDGSIAISDVSPALRAAISRGDVFDGEDLTSAPVAQFFDMDVLDGHMAECKAVFGETFHHHVAIKSNSVSSLVARAYSEFGFGIECASIGEVLHAMNHCHVPADHIVFDSPCKTTRELEWALEQRIHCNLDNFDEFERVQNFFERNPDICTSAGPVGFRINPLVGAGTIAELSVSTAESKFGVPITDKSKLVELYGRYPWLTSVHVHVGSGGMGVKILSAGICVAVDLAEEINRRRPKQISIIDIGGGLPANYDDDSWGRGDCVPTFQQYANHLRQEVPALFTGNFKVITEFGQAMNAKSGFLASRIEWIKGSPENPICIVHFGASECVRQAYGGNKHARRVEPYRADGNRFENAQKCYKSLTAGQGKYSVGGPLCFQGDFVAKNVILPDNIAAGDYIVLKDCGANTLSIFSRHCSRMAPAVWGYRWNANRSIASLFELKAREVAADISRFWGLASVEIPPPLR